MANRIRGYTNEVRLRGLRVKSRFLNPPRWVKPRVDKPVRWGASAVGGFPDLRRLASGFADLFAQRLPGGEATGVRFLTALLNLSVG
ncbi:MAG: hypothetical protein V7K14_11770 [Nostoc sp.]|uniref:hypothetical protein n=1 Tax=Nostoc sp. TaxID=1180 RepID=UPI002FF6C8E7